MKNKIICISIISYVLVMFFGCVAKTKPIKELSEIFNKENMGKRVEIEGYFSVGETMSCISVNSGSKRCALQFRTNVDDKKFISVLIEQDSKKPNSIVKGDINIESLDIRDFQNNPFSPRSKVTLIGYVQSPDEFAKDISDISVVNVDQITVNKESTSDNRYCSESQKFDWTGQEKIINKFKLRPSIGTFFLNKIYSNQTEPKESKQLCDSFAEGVGNYMIISNDKKISDVNVYHRIAFYNTPEKTEKGLKEYLEIQKRKDAKIITDIEVADDEKITFAFKEKLGDLDLTHRVSCYREEETHAPLRMVCHEFFSEDETHISKYVDAWTEFEADLKELIQKEPIDISSMSPTEVIKTIYKVRHDKDAVNYINLMSDLTIRRVFDSERYRKEELTLIIRNFLKNDYSPIKGEPEVRNEQINGNEATAEVKIGDVWLDATLVKEDGKWRLDSDK